jgi:hypothetical protein
MFMPDQQSLVARRTAQLPRALFASQDYPQRRGRPPPDLEGHDVIAYEPPVASTAGGTWLAEHAKRLGWCRPEALPDDAYLSVQGHFSLLCQGVFRSGTTWSPSIETVSFVRSKARPTSLP